MHGILLEAPLLRSTSPSRRVRLYSYQAYHQNVRKPPPIGLEYTSDFEQ
jgi:hypothetical protein